jgi:hypothetical protein
MDDVMLRDNNGWFWISIIFHAIDDAISSIVSSDWFELLYYPERR